MVNAKEIKIMGKSRRNQPSAQLKPSEQLVDKMREWQKSPLFSPSEFLSEEEIDYVKNHMENSENNEDVPTGHLYRMERGYHFEELYYEGELEEGSILKDNSVFRAFSREPSSTGDYLLNHNDGGAVVIYRTNGNVPHYNITKNTHVFENESESWVEPSKLKIDKIQYFNDLDYNMKDVLKSELELSQYPEVMERYDKINQDWIPGEVYIVDVSSVK